MKCNCGVLHAAVSYKSVLAVYELKRVWQSLAGRSSFQTVGLMLEDTLFQPWETISLFGLFHH